MILYNAQISHENNCRRRFHEKKPLLSPEFEPKTFDQSLSPVLWIRETKQRSLRPVVEATKPRACASNRVCFLPLKLVAQVYQEHQLYNSLPYWANSVDVFLSSQSRAWLLLSSASSRLKRFRNSNADLNWESWKPEILVSKSYSRLNLVLEKVLHESGK